MLSAVATARARGRPHRPDLELLGLSRYDRAQLAELFDGVVISGEIGLRKPDPEMYRLGAQAVGLDPGQCVYVDDLPGNLKPARELGMTTIHHRDAATTIAELERLFGTGLSDPSAAR